MRPRVDAGPMAGPMAGSMAGPEDDLERPISDVHRHLAETDSTNARAMDALAGHADDPRSCGAVAIVTADRQHAGRGRMGRDWESSGPRDLYASVALRLPTPTVSIGALGLAVGLALSGGIARVAAELDVGLKWPNDLLVGGRKLGGILIETRWICLLYTSPSPRDQRGSRMPSSA